jgi:hypothetical protein
MLQERVRSQLLNNLLAREANACSRVNHASRFLYSVQEGWYDKLLVCQFRGRRIISKCCVALDWGLVCASPSRRACGWVLCSLRAACRGTEARYFVWDTLFLVVVINNTQMRERGFSLAAKLVLSSSLSPTSKSLATLSFTFSFAFAFPSLTGRGST